MDKIAFSYSQALHRLASFGLSDGQVKAAITNCPIAGSFDGAPYYFPDDIDAMADWFIDGLSIDDCGGDI